MKTFKVLFLCVLLFLLACCTSAPPSSSEIQPSSFPASFNGVSSAEPTASSEPPAESRDVLQMSAEEYYSVCREYVPFDGHSIYPERLQADQYHLWLDIFQSAIHNKMMDLNTSIDPILSHYPEFSQDILPRENYLYWVVWDLPHYWMANPVTC